jgi:hypothetical protein
VTAETEASELPGLIQQKHMERDINENIIVELKELIE